MITIEKELLLKDICGRLPYGVKCLHPYGVSELNSISIEEYGIDLTFKSPDDNYYSIEQCKPYLRSISSMTEEEHKELESIRLRQSLQSVQHVGFDAEILDFYYRHHLDVRFLIPLGLALEAEEGIYKIE